MKSILFLLVVVILTFVITGAVLYSMGDGDNFGESNATIVVEGNAQIVFEWISEPSFSKRWVKGSKGAKKISKGKLKVGSIVRETIKVPNGGTAELTGKILKLKRNKILETQYYVSGMKLKRGKMTPIKRGDYAAKTFDSRIVVEKIDDKNTRVYYTIKAKYGRWYTRFLEPLITSDTVEDMDKSLKALNEKIKKSAAAKLKKKQKKEKEKKKRERNRKQTQFNLDQAKKKNLGKAFDTSGLVRSPELKPMLKLNPKLDVK